VKNKELSGRAAIITGANQGLGLAMARAFVEAGADILICARQVELLEKARRELAGVAAPGQKVLAMPADIAVDADVTALVASALKAFGDQFQILVNNAGVYGPKGNLDEVDWEAWRRAVTINLDGSVLACRAVLPHFKSRRYGKIIQLSGGGATKPLPRLSAYAVSKAAVVRLVDTLAEEVRSCRIDVNAIAPGALNTRMLEEVLAAGPERVGQSFYDSAVKQKAGGGTPLELGAALAVFLASAASDGITGKLISAQWDPWRELPAHLQDLQKTDIYTLRRIVPGDRGMKWGG
jgi:NAD(P)-dependent dehydrogenase (short-subunit alcohol dehydrogenase family)